MVVEPSSLKLEPTKVNLKESKKNIAEQYDSLLDGFQKEAIQNAWDARADDEGKGWRIEISYDPKSHALRAEDFGTTGMNAEKWEKFHSLWYTDKTPTKHLGYRGQGKLLYHACGEYVIAETQDQDGVYRCRYSVPEGFMDYQAKKTREISHQGSTVTIYNVDPKLRDGFRKVSEFVRYIQLTWWEIIENGATIIYRAGKTERKVPPLGFPSCKPENHKVLEDQMVTKGATPFGILRNINLFYSDNEVPEDLRGVAINVRGQTIQRWHPPLMGPQGKRFFGHCNADYLRDAELPNHSGFQGHHPAWKATRQMLELKIKDFLAPLVRSDARIDPKHQRLAGKALAELNSILKFFPELNPMGPGGGPPEPPPKPPVEHTDVYIVSLTCDKPQYLRSETVMLKVHAKNPVSAAKQGYALTMTVRDPENVEAYSSRETLALQAEQESNRDYRFTVSPEGKKGTYYAVAMVYDNAGVRQSARTKIFTVETELERKKKREGRKRSPGKGIGRSSGVAEIRPVRSPQMERDPGVEGPEAHYDADNNVIIVNFSHATAKYIIKNTRGEGLKYHILKCATNELIKHWIRKEIADFDEEDFSSPPRIEQMLNDVFTRQSQVLGKWAGTFMEKVGKSP